jgi:hypothetical protein
MAFLFAGRKLPCSTTCPLEFISFSPGHLATAQHSIGTVISLPFKSTFFCRGTKLIVQLGHDTPSTMQPPSGLYMKLLFGP